MAKLQTNLETVSKGSKQSDHKNKIHSIALRTPNGASTTLAAHMQTMALLHDHQDTLDPEISCDVIEPALEVEKVDKDFLRDKRVENKGASSGEATISAGKSKKVQATKKPTAVAKKSTTAASFFIKSDNGIKKQKAEKDNVTNKSKTKADPKKSKPAEKVVEQKKGNADDFVGDEDEDDDFLKEEEERKKRIALTSEKESRARQIKEKRMEGQEKRKPMPRDDGREVKMDVDEDYEKEDVRGAMDAFACATKKNTTTRNKDSEQKGRKRRKQVLEEKTFVDESGFLRTETVSVWKDIEDSDDEEGKSNSLTAKSSSSFQKPSAGKGKGKAQPKSSKNMKQQGLMGFFAKKG